MSFVAVPAQPRAGTTKNYGGLPSEKPGEEPVKETKNEDLEANLRIKATESFIFSNKEDFKHE